MPSPWQKSKAEGIPQVELGHVSNGIEQLDTWAWFTTKTDTPLKSSMRLARWPAQSFFALVNEGSKWMVQWPSDITLCRMPGGGGFVSAPASWACECTQRTSVLNRSKDSKRQSTSNELYLSFKPAAVQLNSDLSSTESRKETLRQWELHHALHRWLDLNDVDLWYYRTTQPKQTWQTSVLGQPQKVPALQLTKTIQLFSPVCLISMA